MTPADAMLSGILREREALRRAHRLELEAIWREAGEALQGDPSQESTPTGGCGCSGCADKASVPDEAASGHTRRAPRSAQRAVASEQADLRIPEAMGQTFPDDCVEDCRERTGSFEELAACIQDCTEDAWQSEVNAASWRCPSDEPPYFELPDFHSVNLGTQFCFYGQYGKWEWPRTGCCAPPIHATEECEPPGVLEYVVMLMAVDQTTHSSSYNDDGIWITPASASAEDYQLFGASMAMLLKNIDIANWLVCTVKSWSPDMIGSNLISRLNKLLTIKNGKLGFTVSFVDSNTNASMFAFTYRDLQRGNPPPNDGRVGVIIPIGPGASYWETARNGWDRGGMDSVCATVQIASAILHELIHICGDDYKNGVIDAHDRDVPNFPDNYGTRHEIDPDTDLDYPYSCWDEARMITSMFRWAMSQRYTCLNNGRSCCRNMQDTWFFAISHAGTSQINGLEQAIADPCSVD